MSEERQYNIVFTSSTIATSIEQAVHIAMEQVEEGSAHVEVFDADNVVVEPDMSVVMDQRKPVRMTPSDALSYETVVNAARRFAETLTPEQRNLLAALGTAETPERAQIVRDIAQSVFDRDAAPDATQNDALVLANVRYAVGRSTHVVGTTVDLAIARWDYLADQTRETILDEVAYALANGKAGMEMDERDWQRLVDHATPTSGPRF